MKTLTLYRCGWSVKGLICRPCSIVVGGKLVIESVAESLGRYTAPIGARCVRCKDYLEPAP
jgi:hypothetical protein